MNAPEDADAQWKEAARWLAKADEDAVVAELALTCDPPLINPAAFHCQQAAEKMLNALLVSAGAAPPRSHDVELLVEAAALLYPTLAWRCRPSLRRLGGGPPLDYRVVKIRSRADGVDPKPPFARWRAVAFPGSIELVVVLSSPLRLIFEAF